MDGGLSIPFPVKQAIEDECSDILVLLSHPRNYEPVEPKLWQKAMFQLLCSQGRQNTFAAYANSHQASREARDIALGRIPCDPGTRIATLCTDSPPFLHTMTRKREDLVAAATAYGKNTLSVFGVDPSGWELGPVSALR